MSQTKKPPTVLSIVWNLIRGGTEGQCARVAMSMCKRGWDHRVAVFRPEGFFLEPVCNTCGDIYHLDIRRFLSLNTLSEVRKLNNYLREKNIDIVHAWDADAAIFGSMAVKGTSVKFITSRRDMGEIYPAYKIYLMEKADRQADAIVANAACIQSALLNSPPLEKKSHVIRNVIDLKEFDRQLSLPFSLEDKLPTGQPRVAMVARLDPEKGVDRLIEAVALLKERGTVIHLLIAGDGPERKSLEELALRLQVASEVVFLGDVKDVPALLGVCDAAVLTPSSNEGLSNSIIEYMAAGLPVVATDCGGNKELVEDDVSGYVVPIADVDALANALQGVVKKEAAVRMGRAGRTRIETDYTSYTVISRFESLYQQVAGE